MRNNLFGKDSFDLYKIRGCWIVFQIVKRIDIKSELYIFLDKTEFADGL
jgi:hypothetical protein